MEKIVPGQGTIPRSGAPVGLPIERDGRPHERSERVLGVARPRLRAGSSLWIAVPVLLFTGTVYLWGLHEPGLIAPGEPRYAEISRTLLESGDWIVPRFNGQVHLEKPPLTYWATALIFSIFGSSEASVRLFPVLCSFGIAWLCFLLCERLFDRQTGVDAALVLSTAMAWWIFSRTLLTDIPAILAQVGALYCFWRFRESGKAGYAIGVALWLSAATMTRGLIAVLFPCAAMVLFVAARRLWHLLLRRVWLAALALFLVLTIPWHLAVEMRHPGFAEIYFLHNHVARFFGGYPPGGNDSLTLAQFLGLFAAGFFPWTLAMPLVLRHLPELLGLDGKREAVLYLLLWASVVCFFTCLSSSRLERYFLPALPPLAMLAAVVLRREAESGGRLALAFHGSAALCGMSLPAIYFGGVGLPPMMDMVGAYVPWIGAVLTVGPLMAAAVYLRNNRPQALPVLCFFIAASFPIIHQCMILVSPAVSVKSTAERLAGIIDGETMLIVDGSYQHFEGVGFYLRRTVKVLRQTDPEIEDVARWDAALHPHVTPAELQALWGGVNRIVLITRSTGRMEELQQSFAPVYVDQSARPFYLVSNRPLISG